MSIIDWSIMAVPMMVVCFIAYKTNKYMKGVVDFLAAGRIAGRYLVCTATGMASMGVISVIAVCERNYKAGFAIGWWNQLTYPVAVVLTLTGFVVYRYRETRALTLAQFLEMRYSRRFRIFAGLLAAGAGMLNYGIFPAVAGRFFVYFCGLPPLLHIGSSFVPTFALVMAIFLGLALLFVLMGGQLTIMVTDCVQGLFAYAMYLIIALALLYIFSWHQISTALMHAPVDQSLLNPFHTSEVQDFNFWFVLIGIFGGIYTVMAWQGTQGFFCSAASAHEQKMANILGTWRGLVFEVMQTLLAICALTFMTSHDFSAGAAHVNAAIAKIPDAYLQEQMRVPIAMAYFLPIGIKGIFAALMFFLACTNDISYLHSWGSIVAQDVILAFRNEPLGQRAHLLLLRLCITGVTIFAFCFSLLYHQNQYIYFYFAVTGAIFLGGAGSVIIGGLYWRKGTTTAAWAALITGSVTAVGGIYLQHYWPDIAAYLLHYFPGSAFFSHHSAVFPINGQYVNALSMALAIAMYIIVSLLTSREDFNLERMLHRGEYAVDAEGNPAPKPPPPPRTWAAMVGVDEHFTRGDKIIAWSMSLWVLALFVVFVVVSFWNLIRVWPDQWWANYWFYGGVWVPIAMGTVTSIWFSIGGVRDLRRLFHQLRTLHRDPTDDGRVKLKDKSAEQIKDELMRV